MFNVAVIGCGVICENHLQPIKNSDNLNLVAVCDIDKLKADTMAKKYNCNAYYNYEEMINKEQLDSVHICLPHYLHSTAAIYALNKGLDVLCEKPIDLNYSNGVLMQQAAQNNGKLLGVIFQNRYNYSITRFKQLQNKGKLGKILGISAYMLWYRGQEYYDSGDWRGKWATEGGGLVINQSIHTIDLIRYLAGAEVTSVKSSLHHLGKTNIEVEDTANGIIEFSNGVSATFSFTNNALAQYGPNIIVKCENAEVIIEGANATVKYQNGTKETYNNNSKEYVGKKCYGNGHFAQIELFYNEDRKENANFMLTEALKTQKLVDSIYSASGFH